MADGRQCRCHAECGPQRQGRPQMGMVKSRYAQVGTGVSEASALSYPCAGSRDYSSRDYSTGAAGCCSGSYAVYWPTDPKCYAATHGARYPDSNGPITGDGNAVVTVYLRSVAA